MILFIWFSCSVLLFLLCSYIEWNFKGRVDWLDVGTFLFISLVFGPIGLFVLVFVILCTFYRFSLAHFWTVVKRVANATTKRK